MIHMQKKKLYSVIGRIELLSIHLLFISIYILIDFFFNFMCFEIECDKKKGKKTTVR